MGKRRSQCSIADTDKVLSAQRASEGKALSLCIMGGFTERENRSLVKVLPTNTDGKTTFLRESVCV